MFRISDCDLKRGEAIEHQEEIATVVGDGGWQAVGYVDEQYSHLVAPGAKAWFYPDGCPGRRVPLTLVSVDRDAARTISNPMLTTAFGGPLPARLVDGNLVPEHGLYRVRFETNDVPADLATTIRQGRVVVAGKSESLLARFGRAVGAVIWREAGF